MAAKLYDLGRASILNGDFDLLTNNIKAILATASYVRNLTTDQFVSIIGGGNILARSGNFASKAITAGVFDAADITFTAVPAGVDGSQIVIYYDSGSDATSRLIANFDAGTGLPVTPNGTDINVAWDNGANKIFNWQS